MLTAEVRAHGRWSLSFDARPGVKFGVVIEGSCIIAVRGRTPKRLHAGDVFLLAGAPPYVMASDMETPSQVAGDLLRRKRVVQLGNAKQKPVAHLMGGLFSLDVANAHLLIDALPALVRIPAEDAGPLRSVTRLLIDEVRATNNGRLRALDQLAQLVLTYALRWLDVEGNPQTGWLAALADKRINASLHHIHQNVEKGTTLADLSRVAGMSRTSFAARFKELVGQSPLAYALQWRMALAKNALRTTDRAIGALAFELGYESESAFSSGFRREVGCSPRTYRTMHQ